VGSKTLCAAVQSADPRAGTGTAGGPMGAGRGWIQARNAVVAKQPRCKPQSSLRGAQGRVQKYRLGGWVSVRLEGRQVVGWRMPQRGKRRRSWTVVTVVQSDLPVTAATTQAVHDRYLDLTRVERDFRTLKDRAARNPAGVPAPG